MIIYSGHINLRTQKASGGERKGYLQLYTGRRTKSGSPSQHYVNILRLLWLVQRVTWQTSSLQRQLDKTRIHETTYSFLVPLFYAHSTTATKQIIVININNLTALLLGKTVGQTKNHNNNYCKQRQTVKALDTAKPSHTCSGVYLQSAISAALGGDPGPVQLAGISGTEWRLLRNQDLDHTLQTGFCALCRIPGVARRAVAQLHTCTTVHVPPTASAAFTPCKMAFTPFRGSDSKHVLLAHLTKWMELRHKNNCNVSGLFSWTKIEIK